jgi:hypothetical protein
VTYTSRFKRGDHQEGVLVRRSSAYKVGVTSDAHFAFQDRVSPTVALAARSSATPGSSAEHYLGLARRHVYGRHRNPEAGYGEAVKAVECVTLPVVVPEDKLGTLGKVIHAMRDKPSKWETVLRRP